MALTVEDRLDIMQLVAEYNFAIDRRDPQGYANCFTDDGAMRAAGNTLAQGRAALIELVEARRKGGGPQMRHWVDNFVLSGGGNEARLRCYIKAYDVTGPGVGAPILMGEYDDVLVRQGGGWKFRERNLTIWAGMTPKGKSA